MRAAPDDPITVLPGIAAKKEALYRKLSIRSVRQLVLHLPRGRQKAERKRQDF